MKKKVLKTAKPVAFDDVEAASKYLAGLGDGEFEIEVSTKTADHVNVFVKAMAIRERNAGRLDADSLAKFDWRLIGPSTYSITIYRNEIIPVVWKSKTEDLRDKLSALSDGDRIDCYDLGYDPFYVRVVLSKLGVQAYTKTENGRMYIIKGSKPLSALKTIRTFALQLGDDPGLLGIDKPIQYVRTNLSNIETEGYRFSVKELKYGQYLVSKRFDKPAHAEGGLSRAYLASVLSSADLAAYDAIIAKAKAASASTPVPDPEPQRTGGADLVSHTWPKAGEPVYTKPSPVFMPVPEGFVEADPCYMVAETVNDKPAAPDADDYDPKALDTSYLKSALPDDDEDLPF